MLMTTSLITAGLFVFNQNWHQGLKPRLPACRFFRFICKARSNIRTAPLEHSQGTMSTEGPSLTSPPASSTRAFLTAPVTPGTLAVVADPLPVLIALACVFLLLASCLLFLMLCKPAALDPSRHASARELLPHHPASPSEPRLQLWKRLGSLRRSLPSFRRGRPVPGRPLPGHDDSLGDSDCTESTKM
ncbi:uncharacterized protein C10orf105 homolog isoform X2 [Cavia porcellus]|uniref:uncharacterized protein C10orf105 homolog isoform X2 n=1 Tax=Cavia porcellus TaxID=10141 RepID=UPI002FE36B81